METGINLTGYDLVVVGLFILFIIRGIWLGLLKQVTGLLALCLGYFVASQYHDRLFPFLKEISDNPKVVFVIAFVILFVVTYVVTLLVGKVLAHVVEITFSTWFDKFLGALLGMVKAAIVAILVHLMLSSILSPESTIIKDCRACDGLNIAAEYAREIIQDEAVRKSLMQQAPAISAEAVREIVDDTLQLEARQPEEPEDLQQDLSAPVE